MALKVNVGGKEHNIKKVTFTSGGVLRVIQKLTMNDNTVFTSGEADLSGVPSQVLRQGGGSEITAGYRINVNGTHQVEINPTQVISPNWFVSGDIANFKVRATQLSGNFVYGNDLDVWLDFSFNRSWKVINASQGSVNAIIRIDLSADDGDTIVASAEINMIAAKI